MQRLSDDLTRLLVTLGGMDVPGPDGTPRCRLEWRPTAPHPWWVVAPDGAEGMDSIGELLWELQSMRCLSVVERLVLSARHRLLFPMGSSLGWEPCPLSAWQERSLDAHQPQTEHVHRPEPRPERISNPSFANYSIHNQTFTNEKRT